MTLIPEIKKQINVLEYAENVLEITINNGRGISPISGTNITECAYYETWFYDFKHNVGGDIIDLCAFSKYNGNRGLAIKELAAYANITYEISHNWQPYIQQLGGYIAKCHASLSEDHKHYILNRGITLETINRLKLGTQHDRILIPYWKNNYVAYYTARGSNPKYKKASRDNYNENIIWGLHTLNRSNENLFLCEGAFDGISLDQENYSVLCSMGSSFTQDQLKQVIKICKMYKIIYLCFDNDKAGKIFFEKMADIFIENRIRFNTLNHPNFKDISAYYKKFGNFTKLIKNYEDGILTRVKNITDKIIFKKMMYKIGLYVDKAILADLFENLKEHTIFSEIFLKEIYKKCIQIPPDVYILNNLLHKYNILYNEGLGFFEYKKGVWNIKSETEIKKYVIYELGRFMTGAKMNSCLALYKAEVNNKKMFNKKEVVNFRNGVLDLKTDTLIKHSSHFMSSFQVKYNYDPNADCPKWHQFIRDITGDDIIKMNLLQEMVGYILFPNNSLQKAFFLLGVGANGKSVFLNVIESLFTSNAITNVDMSGLAEPFQRIQLATAILNVSSETNSKFNDGESIFKQAVVGDKITGCYKNKDFITFETRAKFFIACNQFVHSKDSTEGFLRRILFLKFNTFFVENPILNSSSKKVDKNITPKLQKELPGIFNWLYMGYKRLKINMSFTIHSEQKEVMRDYMKMLDPVYAFFIDFGTTITEIETNQLYEEFKIWCMNQSLFPMTRTQFLYKVRNNIQIKNINFIEIGCMMRLEYIVN